MRLPFATASACSFVACGGVSPAPPDGLALVFDHEGTSLSGTLLRGSVRRSVGCDPVAASDAP